MLILRRNFSSRARELSGGDTIIVSVPKSGRTWVRTFLCAYFCKLRGYEFTLDPDRYGDAAIPRLIYTHDLFEHRTKGRAWDRVRGKYLVPACELHRANIILLARDPRDCFVSLYHQMTRRTPETPEQLRRKTISELLREERFGIRAIIQTMNHWMAEFSGRRNFRLIRYESLRAAPVENFGELLAALGKVAPKMPILEEALEFARFENMQRLEAAGGFDSKILQAGDVGDPESFKVRRGKIGGYADYLSVEDRQYAAEAMLKLDARFGYDTGQ